MKIETLINSSLKTVLVQEYKKFISESPNPDRFFAPFLDFFLKKNQIEAYLIYEDYDDIRAQLDSFISHEVEKPSRNLIEIQTDSAVTQSTAKNRIIHRPVAPVVSQTTKTAIPTCPIDLLVPSGYTFSADGIQRFTKKGELELVSYTPIVITRRYIEPDTYQHKYEIAFTNHEDKWIKKVFNKDVIDSERKILQLASFGPGFTSAEAKHVARFLNALINNRTNKRILATTEAYNQPGWNEDFTKFIYPSGGEDYICHRPGFDYDKLFYTKGDSKKWIDMFQQVSFNGGSVARLILGAGVVAPLVRRLNLPNIQAHLHGSRGIGKSPLPKFAASTFGNPRAGKLTRTFAGTMKNKLEIAAAFNDLPLILDELETVGSKTEEDKLSAMIYDFSLGVANQANKRDGTARAPVEFAGCRISTGERPLVKSTDKGGAFKRVLDIRVNKLFEDSFASELHSFSENNFGHFGKAWTDYIIKNFDSIRKDFEEALYFTRKHGFYINGKLEYLNIEPTQLKAVIACMTAFKHFQLCIGIQLAGNYDDEFYSDIAQIILKLPTTNQIADSARAKEALASFVVGHLKSFAAETKSKDIPERNAETYEIFGKIFNNGEVAILPHKLKQILEKELGFSSAEKLIAEWADSYLLITQGRGNQYRVRIDGNPVWTYKFKSGVLIQKGENNNPDDNSDS